MRYPYIREKQRVNTDVPKKGVDRGFIAHIEVSATAATAQSVINVLAATPLTDAPQSITTGITDPSVPRNAVVVANVAGVTGDVVITGESYLDGDIITETLALNGDTPVVGAKAFREFTQIDLPIETNVGTDTVSVGTGEVLGLPYLLANNTVLKTYLDNTIEGTAPTLAISTTAIESNTIKLNSTLNGTAIDLYLIV